MIEKKKVLKKKEETKVPTAITVVPTETALRVEIETLKAENERLRGNVAGLEESLNARGTEVIALRNALEERDRIIAELKS